MKRIGVIVVLALMAMLLCPLAVFAQEEAPVVYFPGRPVICIQSPRLGTR